jgi:hypothetical protein
VEQLTQLKVVLAYTAENLNERQPMRKKTMTAGPAPKEPPRFDPATWVTQARNLAHGDADSVTIIVALFLINGSLLSMLAAHLVFKVPLDDIFTPTLLFIAVSIGIILTSVWTTVYAVTLYNLNKKVQLATWQLELDLGIDLNDDGQLGQPKSSSVPPAAGHPMTIGGTNPKTVILPDIVQVQKAPKLQGFPVSANDVVFILSHVKAQGLSVRSWERTVLPSKTVVDRDLWVAIIKGMEEWKMITIKTDKAGKRWPMLNPEAKVEDMIASVRKTAGIKDEGDEEEDLGPSQSE